MAIYLLLGVAYVWLMWMILHDANQHKMPERFRTPNDQNPFTL